MVPCGDPPAARSPIYVTQRSVAGMLSVWAVLPSKVKGACYARVNPTPLQNPRLVAASDEALRLLDLSPDEVQSQCPLLPSSLHEVQPVVMWYSQIQYPSLWRDLNTGQPLFPRGDIDKPTTLMSAAQIFCWSA
jgi:hypothetical protein